MTSDNVNDFLGTSAGGPLSLLAATLIRGTNPHVRWVETDGHGFGVLDVTPSRCRMDWYHLADRTRRASPARWVQGWSVGRGSARIRRESAPGEWAVAVEGALQHAFAVGQPGHRLLE